jgi:hypothetical protein
MTEGTIGPDEAGALLVGAKPPAELRAPCPTRARRQQLRSPLEVERLASRITGLRDAPSAL